MSLLSANLQAFERVAGLKSVSAAAKELSLTQTAVTQRLRALERELGATFFLRSRRGMSLTREGEALLRYCLSARDLEGSALAQIRGGGKERTVDLTLTGPTSAMSSRIATQCAPLYHLWPGLQLHLRVSDEATGIQWLRSGEATLALVPPHEVPVEMDSKRLRPERYLLVASARWKGRRLAEILENERVIDFYEADPTTRVYLQKFGLESRRPRLFVNNNEALKSLLEEGVGYGTLTQEIARPLLEKGTLVTLNGGAAYEDPLALAWIPRPELPPYLAAVIRAIR